MSQLRLTVLADIQSYLQPMIHFFVTDSTIQMRAPLSDGTTIHADWILIPLDTKMDVQRLLSTQLTAAWVNELREVPVEVITALIGRLGRYPSRLHGGPSWFGLIADTNPWDVDSPYHERFILDPTPQWRMFHQPSGVGPGAENLGNLPPGYYENLLTERDGDWSDVFVRSEFGVSNAGQAVFRRSFNANVHVKNMDVVVNPQRPLLLGMDFGRTPCMLIGQTDVFGRLLIFEEITTEDMGLRQFLTERVKPRLLGLPYAGKRMFVVGDPAGGQKSQLAEETAFDVIKQTGLAAYPAVTNDVGSRLLAVEKLLCGQSNGEPLLQISRAGCPTLIRALGGQYKYRKKRDGQLEEKPEKLHPWSDVADSLQYMALATNADLTSYYVARVRAQGQPRPVERRFTAAAWT